MEGAGEGMEAGPDGRRMRCRPDDGACSTVPSREWRLRSDEQLHQPLEDARVTLSRADVSLTYPSRFMRVAAHVLEAVQSRSLGRLPKGSGKAIDAVQ